MEISFHSKTNPDWPCTIENCSSKFSKRANLTNHINVAHKGLRFLCGSCDAFTTSRDSIKNHIKSKHPKQSPTDDELKGQFFFIDENGSPFPLNAKLERITQLKKLFQQEMTKYEELSTALNERQTSTQTPLADETTWPNNTVDKTLAGASNPKATKSTLLKTKASVKDFEDLNPSLKKNRASTTFIAENEWSREEDRILLESLKNGLDYNIQLENRSEQETISRITFLTNFVKNLKK